MNEIKNLFRQQNIESTTRYFLQNLKGRYLYFKWLDSECALKLEYAFPSYCSNTWANTRANTRAKILRLYESHPDFRMEHLRTPEKILHLNRFVQKISGNKNMKGRLISVRKKPFAVLFSENLNNVFVDCFENHCELLLWKNQCMSFSSQDYFLKILYEEISRARRLLHPVSLVLIKCSSQSSMNTDNGVRFDKGLFLKSLMNHIRKNNRLYDTLVQISDDEIACILPHTSEKGALQKAGQIQGLFKTLAQKNILKGCECQVAVAEYPTVGRDAVSLIHLAREACSSGNGQNICVAQIPVSFRPDFSVRSDEASLSELI